MCVHAVPRQMAKHAFNKYSFFFLPKRTDAGAEQHVIGGKRSQGGASVRLSAPAGTL